MVRKLIIQYYSHVILENQKESMLPVNRRLIWKDKNSQKVNLYITKKRKDKR